MHLEGRCNLDVDADRGCHGPIVDAGPDHHPEPRPLDPDPQRHADRNRDADHEQPERGIGQVIHAQAERSAQGVRR